MCCHSRLAITRFRLQNPMSQRSGQLPSLQRALGIVGLLALVVMLSLVSSAIGTTYLFQGASAPDGFWGDLLFIRGPQKVMPRILMLMLLILLPITLRFSCWRGCRDTGLMAGSRGYPTRRWWKDLLTGFSLGILTLGSGALLVALMGFRFLVPPRGIGAATFQVLYYLVAAAVVGFLEEVWTRGILFRSLARVFHVWPTAVAISFFFAVGHLLQPDPERFDQGPLWETSRAALFSMFESLPHVPFVEMRILNLFLMGVLLCLVVHRLGTIWFAAGLHSGWVWIKRLNQDLTDANREVTHSLLWGARSDLTDGLLCTGLLLLLALFIWRRIWQ